MHVVCYKTGLFGACCSSTLPSKQINEPHSWSRKRVTPQGVLKIGSVPPKIVGVVDPELPLSARSRFDASRFWWRWTRLTAMNCLRGRWCRCRSWRERSIPQRGMPDATVGHRDALGFLLCAAPEARIAREPVGVPDHEHLPIGGLNLVGGCAPRHFEDGVVGGQGRRIRAHRLFRHEPGVVMP